MYIILRKIFLIYFISLLQCKDSVRDIVVTWSTIKKVTYSACVYGINNLKHSTKNLQGPTEFVDGGLKRRVQYIHRVS